MDLPTEEQMSAALAVKANRGARGNRAPECAEKRQLMRNDTNQLLRDFYAPHNKRLADMLGDTSYMWTLPVD